jgi:hypothetical protein
VAPTEVSPATIGYAGEWGGTTSQGATIRFSVSAADTVTSITLDYTGSGECSGTLSYTDLSLPIHELDPPRPPPLDQPGFGYTTQANDGTHGVLITSYFSEDRQVAIGRFILVNWGNCASMAADWQATKR